MKNWQELAAICRTCNCSVQYAEPLRNHTTFRIGGACSAFVNVNSEETLRQILGLCRDRNYPYLVLGNGSNILAADSGYAGVILHLGKDFSQIRQDGTTLYCEAGATLGRIGKFALEESLTGMECLAGIPGTVGGALYMNAGAYGGEMADVIVSARCMAPDGTISVVPKAEMELGYRKSIFRQDGRIILGVTLQLKKGSYGAIKEEMDSLLGKRRAKPAAGTAQCRQHLSKTGGQLCLISDRPVRSERCQRRRCTGECKACRLRGQYRQGDLSRCAGTVR